MHPPQAPFELACASEVFGLDRPGLPSPYTFELCTEDPGLVRTLAGYDLGVTVGLEALDRADTIVVPGWHPAGTEASAAVLDGLRAAHQAGVRILSICSGAFVLAQAGLLDGRRATTHWRLAAALATRFPRVRVDSDVLYVDHGDVATSAGTAAGIDLCLHIVRRDHGAAFTAEIARHMVMPPHREGGQLQFVSPPVRRDDTDPLAPLLDWAAARLHEPISVARLAAAAGVSERTMDRRFRERAGVSPGRWVLVQRVTAARVLLEQTTLPVDAVASRVGLGSAVNLRRHFHRILGTTPAAYRRTFRQRTSPVAAGGSGPSTV
ncbi:MAG TPA: helix-turn-helix domain-containing protein [Mycobacteriales bacterium]